MLMKGRESSEDKGETEPRLRRGLVPGPGAG